MQGCECGSQQREPCWRGRCRRCGLCCRRHATDPRARAPACLALPTTLKPRMPIPCRHCRLHCCTGRPPGRRARRDCLLPLRSDAVHVRSALKIALGSRPSCQPDYAYGMWVVLLESWCICCRPCTTPSGSGTHLQQAMRAVGKGSHDTLVQLGPPVALMTKSTVVITVRSTLGSARAHDSVSLTRPPRCHKHLCIGLDSAFTKRCKSRTQSAGRKDE